MKIQDKASFIEFIYVEKFHISIINDSTVY